MKPGRYLLLLGFAAGGVYLFLRRRRRPLAPPARPFTLLQGDEFDQIVARISDVAVDTDPTPPHGIVRPVDRAMPLPGTSSFRDRQLAARLEEEDRRRYRR